jgi:hypothetical protein
MDMERRSVIAGMAVFAVAAPAAANNKGTLRTG